MGFAIQRDGDTIYILFFLFFLKNYIFCFDRTDRIPVITTDEAGLSTTKAAKGIIGGGKFAGIHVLHTSYYQYLRHQFGFENLPVILHGVFYRHEPYLRADILNFLTLRRSLKQDGSLVALAKATFLKLILNSIYGYTLLKMNNEVSLGN